jgi:DeoR family fructose operon transcriptional repressor
LDFTVKRMKNTDIIGNANRCWDIAQKYVIMKYGHDPAGMRMNGAACADMGRNAKQEETVMLAQQRYQKILDLLEEHGIVHSADLVQEMKVSSETVRKDLDALEQSGKLKRVHGGAVPISQMSAQNGQYISLKTRNSSCMEEKAAIAAYAAGLVREHQAVGLDYGSTSLVMAKELVRRFEHLTVVTNSIQNALVLSERPEFTIILIGGILDKKELSLGNDFSQMLESLHLDILFMSVSGVHPSVGLTDQGPSEARVQKQMCQIANRKVVLADSSKFGRASLVKLCALCDVDQIITDGGLDTDMEQKIKDTGVTLDVVRNGER